MVQYIRAKCIDCGNTVLLKYETDPAPPMEEGDYFEGYCPACKAKTTLQAMKKYS